MHQNEAKVAVRMIDSSFVEFILLMAQVLLQLAQ
jgi:hypothetical protein